MSKRVFEDSKHLGNLVSYAYDTLKSFDFDGLMLSFLHYVSKSVDALFYEVLMVSVLISNQVISMDSTKIF